MKSTIPDAVWQGSFNLCGVEIRCAVLDDGSRVIEARSFAEFFDAIQEPGAEVDHAELEAFSEWQRGSEIKPA